MIGKGEGGEGGEFEGGGEEVRVSQALPPIPLRKGKKEKRKTWRTWKGGEGRKRSVFSLSSFLISRLGRGKRRKAQGTSLLGGRKGKGKEDG